MSTDNRQISQAPSSSGGEGGIFGNASAAIGDIGLGTSSAALGDTNFDTTRYFNFSAPVVNKRNGEFVTLGFLIVAGLYFVPRLLKRGG